LVLKVQINGNTMTKTVNKEPILALSKGFYSNTMVEGETFEGASFSHANFERVIFKNVKFDSCVFQQTKFIYCHFENCDISDSLISELEFEGGTITQLNVVQSSGENINFENVRINMLHFSSLSMSNTIFNRCEVSKLSEDSSTFYGLLSCKSVFQETDKGLLKIVDEWDDSNISDAFISDEDMITNKHLSLLNMVQLKVSLLSKFILLIGILFVFLGGAFLLLTFDYSLFVNYYENGIEYDTGVGELIIYGAVIAVALAIYSVINICLERLILKMFKLNIHKSKGKRSQQ